MKTMYEIELENKVKLLENELKKFRFNSQNESAVSVPENLKPIFDKAQSTVQNYFKDLILDPSHGTITIGDQRYLLIRAASLSIDFAGTIKTLYSNRGENEATLIGNDILFDVSHSIGINDAKAFHHKMGLKDPISKLSAGPIHFAYSGWAFVDILAESNPSPDDNYFLIYNHPFSFEADSWIRAGKKSKMPVCIMNSGYSSGWCEESFGIPLTAVEITCKAKGDDKCTFIMAPPHKIKEHLNKYLIDTELIYKQKVNYIIPSFFERKKAEENLKNAKEKAEFEKNKTDQSNKELEKNIKLLETANKELESFSYTVSHDLRAPIRAIDGFTKVIEKKYSSQFDEEGKEFLKIVIKEAGRMGKLIDDLLAFSRLGRKEIEKSKVDMTTMAKEAMNEVLKSEGEKYKAKTIISALLPAHCDSALIRQVWINLISNALKYSQPKPEPVIEIDSYSEGDFIIYSVKDNGVGFDMKYYDKLFGVFQRLHGENEFSGTGIGLAIVSRIITRHYGKVWAEGKVNEGAIFYFSLPK